MQRFSKAFTLIEVLIALLILSLAFTAIIKTLMTDSRNMGYLQDKMMGHWVALEIMSQAQLGLVDLSADKSEAAGQMQMFKHHYQWQAQSQPMWHGLQIQVEVQDGQNGRQLDKLTGFAK